MRATERQSERRSGDDVRRDLIFDEGDAVAQLQLALLQTLQLQQVRSRRRLQRRDRGIQIAMFLLQTQKLCLELAVVFVGDQRLIRIVRAASRTTSRDAPRERH